ncbi:type IV secretion system protein [Neisseria musculi]|uniref:TrbL/VirB6 plasmid conjugal transfer family protein n=1 Tax=Neisseria musculi TaxID=1815583 RepID=A0A7H1MBD4_9NEIS|nr:type IV secretion system protein [Neisseria musculi]QNT58949.1 trbL/VirB6 plasmid conjugal transfer family protein [Neisseria musculi]
MTYFSQTAKLFGADLGQNLLEKSSYLISEISPLFQAAFACYVLLVVISYHGQGSAESMVDFTKRAIGWVAVICLSFSPAVFMKLAMIIYQLPDELASSFAGGYKVDAAAMDASWNELMKLSGKIYNIHDKYTWYEIPAHLTIFFKINLTVVVFGTLIIAVAFAYYMVAKISLALVLMLGPFFLGCLLFPSTRQYGINWIGSCLNYIITTCMFVLLTMVQMQAFNYAVKTFLTGALFVDAMKAQELPTLFLLQAIVFLVVAFNIPNIASTLTGGTAIQGAARQLGQMARAGGFAGRAIGKTINAVANAAGRRTGGTISPNRRPS